MVFVDLGVGPNRLNKSLQMWLSLFPVLVQIVDDRAVLGVEKRLVLAFLLNGLLGYLLLPFV